MAEKLMVSISGMRGIIGENLTASVATEYGCAFGTFLKKKYPAKKQQLTVCLGRDSRPSGRMLGSAVTAGLCSVGIDVIDLGLVTTPGASVMLRQLACAGGVVITASHNPIQYNGIKLLLGNGIAPPPLEAEQIRRCFFDKDFAFVSSASRGKVTSSEQTDAVHVSKVLAIVDRETIAARKFKVVLDSVNGAGGPVTKKLLAELDCEVVPVNDEPTGLFAHEPEPAAENLTGLGQIVQAEGANVGFAQDPDADRLAIIDENGTYVGEEYTLALVAKHIFAKTSRMIDDIAEKAGGRVIRTAVGEANVAAAMLENDCIIGGEGNGGVIDLRVGPVRDSLVGIALILQLMAETGKTVNQLVGELGGYYMNKAKFAADHTQAQRVLDLAKDKFAGARLDTTDGCRFDFDEGWIHARASNTEPVMRVIIEAKDRPAAQEYIDAVLKIRNEVLS
jgi:phosphomannomutase